MWPIPSPSTIPRMSSAPLSSIWSLMWSVDSSSPLAIRSSRTPNIDRSDFVAREKNQAFAHVAARVVVHGKRGAGWIPNDLNAPVVLENLPSRVGLFVFQKKCVIPPCRSPHSLPQTVCREQLPEFALTEMARDGSFYPKPPRSHSSDCDPNRNCDLPNLVTASLYDRLL